MRSHPQCIVAALLLLALTQAGPVSAAQPPNVLWITAEDMSATLGCYGDAFATSPHIDALARESVRYTHAFATSPVCSPSRSCLINGCIASSQGTHNMRSEFPIPEPMNGFPAWLRQAGYYTTNNVKTDYNSGNAGQIIRASWDESSDTAHWRNRPADKPFFAVFNLMTSHQSRSMVWSDEQFQTEVQSQLSQAQIHDPAAVPVPPYYPDTPLIRQTLARYYDCVAVMDKQVGQILGQLQQDGLADSTIVFFYSDHGSGMPRHKRVLLDSGMHVPLLIRFPESFKHLAPGKAGSTTDRLVSFDDFGPTVLALAGIESRPDFMRGNVFLGESSDPPRRYVYGHRDRVDEVIDMARSVRDHRFLYIRNYMPHLGYNQHSAWVDQSKMIHEFYRSAASGTMTAAQQHYAGPTRAVEELYDCQRDPLNLKNLARSPAHDKVLRRLRGEHRRWVLSTRDLGFLPETELRKLPAGMTAMQWAQGDDYRLAEILAVASLVGSEQWRAMRDGLSSDNAAIRYWSVVGLGTLSQLDDSCLTALTAALKDPALIVRIESAAVLARHGHRDVSLPVLRELLQSEDTTVLLHAARAVELLGDKAVTLHGSMSDLFKRFETDPADAAWFIRFTTSGFLERVDPP
jgi:arylsulfatase A-like enzyme